MAHDCPKLGCPQRVQDEMFACRSHWYSLPQPIRTKIWRAYRKHGVGSAELTAAHLEALEHWEQA